MKLQWIVVLPLFLFACQKQKIDSKSDFSEYRIKAEEKIKTDKLMCVQDICVSEADIYHERGPLVYSLDDKLFQQKYDMAKTILLQKLIEKKISASGEKFSEYHRKVKSGITVTDEEVQAFLEKLKLNTIKKDSEQFSELKNHLINKKIEAQYQKTVNEKTNDTVLFVNVPKKERPVVSLDYAKLVKHLSSGNDTKKIVIAFNPSIREQKGIFQIVSSLSNLKKEEGLNFGWFFLPITDGKEQQLNYEKAFLCSMKNDGGRSYRSLLEVSMQFEKDAQIFEFLSSREKNIAEFKKCFSDSSTTKQIEELAAQSKQAGLMNATQLVIDGEVRSYIPGLLGFMGII